MNSSLFRNHTLIATLSARQHHSTHASAADRSRRLGRYGALAAASAAATAGLGTEADAAVVTSSAGFVQTATVDNSTPSSTLSAWGTGATLLNGKIRVFGFVSPTSSRAAGVRVVAGVSFARVGAGPSGPLAKFASGDDVNAGLNWGGGFGVFMASYYLGPFSGTTGAWSLGSDGLSGTQSSRGFFAFRISDGGSDYYYGYFDLETSRSGTDPTSSLTITIHGWAYESTPGQQIVIGGATAVPGGAGLAALAFGAAGLRGRRRSRN